MSEWNNEQEFFSLIRDELYTPVAGDILDALGRYHQFLPQPIHPAKKVLVIEEKEERVRLKIFYADVIQSITINPDGIMVEDRFTGEGIEAIRVDYPMLVFDGKEEAGITMDGNSVRLGFADESVQFSVVLPEGVTLQRSGKQLNHRNGRVEAAFAETTGRRLVYRITAE